MKRYSVVLCAVIAAAAILGLAAAYATTTVSTSTTAAADGSTYTYSYTYDDVSYVSFETLVQTRPDGTKIVVASLRTAQDGSWTGQIYGRDYQDQWSDLIGDYVVIVGADIWPTWVQFSDELYSLPGWGTAFVGPLPYEGGGIVALSSSASGSSGSKSETVKLYGVENALVKSGRHGSARAGSVLFQLWLKGVGNPTPPAGTKTK